MDNLFRTVSSNNWSVLRHSGRINTELRIVFEGTEEKARTKYQKISTDLRQGEVILLAPNGRVEGRDWTPRRKKTNW